MNSSARPSSCCRSCSRLTICALTDTSSAETASSQTIRSGSAASARAMPMRWRWPPENSCGQRLTASRGSRTTSIRRATRASRSAPDLARPKLRIGSARISRTRRRGLRLEKGSWNTTCMRRRSGPQCAGGEIVDALAVQDHLPAGDVEQAQDAAADRRFAASGFADQRQRLALVDGEGHAVDGIDRGRIRAEQARAHREVLLEIVDLEQRHGSCGRGLLRRVVAGREVARRLQFERRRRLPAQIGRERAAAGEHAARDALLQARHHARNLDEPGLQCRRARSRASAPLRTGPACRGGADSGRAGRPAPPPPCGPRTSPSRARRPRRRCRDHA